MTASSVQCKLLYQPTCAHGSIYQESYMTRGQLFEMLAAHDGRHWTELKSTLLKNSRDEELKLRCLTITAINPKLTDHSTEHILN